jgi:hypothetical protein
MCWASDRRSTSERVLDGASGSLSSLGSSTHQGVPSVTSRSIVVALLIAGPLDAQVPSVEPGDSRLRTSTIRVGTDSFRIESTFGGQSRQSTMIRTISRQRADGREVFVFAQLYRTERGNTVDTSWVDTQTLAPVRYFADVYGEIQAFRFDGKDGTGTVTPKDSAARTVTVSAATSFFNAVAIDLVYASLPWTDGSSFGIPVYNPPRAHFVIELRTVGQERLPLAAGGTIDAWKLEYRLGPNAQTLWLDQRTGDFLRIGGSQAAGSFYKYRMDLAPPPP